MTTANSHLTLRALDGDADALLGCDGRARIAVAAYQLTEASLEQLLDSRAERYLAMFQRFCTKVVLGLGCTVALDLLRDADGFAARILLAQVHRNGEPDPIRPDIELERLRLNVSRWITLKPSNPDSHLESVSKLPAAVVIEPAEMRVESGELKASAILPLELTPSGIGLLAELVDSTPTQHTLVRLLIAPAIGQPPPDSLLLEQMSAVETIRSNALTPPSVTYQASAIRKGLQRMMNCWHGQACAVEIQVRAVTGHSMERISHVLCSELSRPKDDELHRVLGQRVTWWSDASAEPPVLFGSPRAVPLRNGFSSPLPVPSYWISGKGNRPKHLSTMNAAFLLVVPPSPQYCDLSSVGTSLVEDRTAKRPELWQDASHVCSDSAGNKIGFDRDAMNRHVHTVGVPGSGKTTLLHQMVDADIASADGFIVLDPHSDLARRITEGARWREAGGKPIGTSSVTTIGDFPGLRLLAAIEDGTDLVDRDIGVLIEAIEAPLPKEFTGPRFRQLMRMCLTLHAHVGRGKLVADAFDVLNDEETARTVLNGYRGPGWVREQLNGFWEPHQNLGDRQDVADWATSKITDYLRTDIARRMFAPVGEGLTGAELAASGVRIVAEFASSNISMHDGGMLGQLFLTVFLRSAMTGGPRLDRRFMIYLDEVHIFFGPSVDKLLTEGRKYGLSVVAAHQSASQLSQPRFDALMAQVGLEVVFRSSLRDSALLAERFGIASESIANLPDFRAWIAGSVAMGRGGPFLADVEHPW